jgi:hypothetical protein
VLRDDEPTLPFKDFIPPMLRRAQTDRAAVLVQFHRKSTAIIKSGSTVEKTSDDNISRDERFLDWWHLR